MESPPKSTVLLALLLEFFILSAVAVPLSKREQCARHCTESNTFQYSPGSTYTYDYETTTTSMLSSTSDEKSKLQMRAQVDIEVLSKCEFSMRLRGVTLKQTDPYNVNHLVPVKGGRDFSKSIESRILRFSFQDGVIQEICPGENAEPWITNIQRGVLSALQNSMRNLKGNERLIETDVSGSCPVEYQSLGRSWTGVLTIYKIKDLNACTDRENSETSLQGTPFARGSSITSRPLLAGQQECEQNIGRGILQSSSCTELLVFRPFSREGSGATTVVTQKLTYAAVSQKSFTGNDYRLLREHLLYNHDKSTTSSSALQETEKALENLCAASATEISMSVPEKFAEFVYNLRKLDYDSLISVYRRTGEICPSGNARKFLLDALPIISTPDSVKLMADMISRKDVSTSEANFWFTSLSFVSTPSAEMIKHLTPLLDGQHEQAYLGVASLVHTFCMKNDCSKVSEVRDIVYRLFDNLGENCFNPDVRKTLLTLKSIGNIGIAYGREKILERCATNPQLKIEVRLAAIQAFRRFSCDIPRDMFLLTYTNQKEKTEMRIASYLAVMACPSSDNLQIVRETLENEQVNQVGSFVWTHLQALLKSKHPDRQDIREVLSNLYLLNKYNSDIRKFSSAHEASFYLESIDSGLHVDSHLVFPTHSFLPHSAMLNLTVDIFGHSCNLLQLDGRMEGIEKVMERFFGPSGYFPQKDISKLLRNKRSIADNKIEKMDREFDVRTELDETPYGSLDVKIFGNTLWYSQFEEKEEGDAAINLMDIITDLAKDKTVSFTRSFMFLDTTYTIPVTSGLPLRLDLNGTASVNVNLGGRFNVRTFKNVDVHIHVESSGTVEIAGLLTVDAGQTSRTGLRISGTMHSSSYLDTTVEIENGQIKAVLNVPKEKIDIIDLRSKLYLVHGAGEKEAGGSAQQTAYDADSCTGENLSKVLGIELCTHVHLPGGSKNSPMYPMNGAATVGVYIKKTDPKLTQYTFAASYEETMVKNQKVRDAVFSLNTPQSKVDREISLKFHHSEPDNAMTFDVKTPVKKFGVRANFLNVDGQKKLDLSSTVDSREIFSAKCDLRRTIEGGGSSYYPSMEVSIPSKKLISLAGSFHLRRGMKYAGQMTVKDVTEKPIMLKGSFETNRQEQRYQGEVDLNSYALESNVKWDAQLGDGSYARLNTEYRLMGGRQYKAGLNAKLRNLSAAALKKYNAILNLQASAFPEWETAITLDSMSTRGHQENSLFINIGDAARSRMHKIELQEIVRYSGSAWNNSVDATFKISYPEKNINYNLKMKHENTESSLKNSVDLKYQKNKQVSTSIDVGMRTNRPLSVHGDFKLQYPGRETRFTSELSESSPREYRLSTSVQWQRGRRTSFIGQYKDKGDRNRVKHDVEAEVSFSNRSPITMSGSIGAHRGQYAGFVEMKNGIEHHYRASADYSIGPAISHRMSAQLLMNTEIYATEASLQSSGDKFSCNMDVKMPSRRRVSTNVDVKQNRSFKSASMEVMWDADRDRTKRIAVDGELHYKGNGYDAKLTTQVQRRTVRCTISTSRDGRLFSGVLNSLYKGELEWSPRNKATLILSNSILLDRTVHRISSVLTVTTPYRGYEVMSMNIRHGDENMQWSTEMTANVGTENRYGITSNGKFSPGRNDLSLEVNFGVQTPMPGYESNSFNLTHIHNQREFSNKMLLLWGMGKRAESEVYSFPTEAGFTSGFKLKTPFAVVEDVSAEVSHGNAPSGYKTTGEIKWAPRRVSNIVIESRHELNGRRRTCSVDVRALTPVRGLESISWKTIYVNDGMTMTTKSEAGWGRCQKMTLGLSSFKKITYFEKNLEGKIHFTSKCLQIEGYDDMMISTAFKRTPDTLNLNFDSKLPHDHTVVFSTEGKSISTKRVDLDGMLKWKLPYFRSNQKISANVEHKMENSEMRTVLDVSYGRKKSSILLTGSNKQSYRSKNIEGSLLVRTPVRGFEEMKVDVIHTNQDWDFMSRLQTSLNGEGIALVHELNVKDRLNFESSLHMTSYVKGVSNWKATVSQMYNPGYFEHNTNLQLDNKNAFSVNYRYQDKLPTKQVIARIDTMYKPMENFVLETEYELGNSEFKSKVKTQLNGREHLSFEGSGKHYNMRTAETQLSLMSNIGDAQRYQMTGRYDLTTLKKTVDLSLEWARERSKTLSLSGTFLMNRESPYFDLIVKTPFQAAERLGLSGRAENKHGEKSLFLEFERNSIKTTLTANYEGKPGEMVVNAGVISPFKEARDVRFSAKYRNINGGINAETFVQLDDSKRASFTTRITLADQRIDGKVSLTSPFANYGPYGLDFSGDLSGKRKTANLIARWENRNKIEVTAECEVVRGRQGQFAITFRSPFQTLHEISTAAEYSFDPKEVNAKFDVHSRKELMYSMRVNYVKNEVLNFELITPYRPVRTSSFKVVLNKGNEECKATATAKWEDRQIDTSVTILHPRNGPVKIQVELKTPFTSFESFSFDGQMMTSNRKPFDGQFALRTPLNFLRRLDASTVIKSEADVYDMLFRLNTESKNLMVSGQASKIIAVPFRSSLSIDAPFTSFKNLVVKMDIQKIEGLSGHKGQISVIYPGSSHVFTGEYMKDQEDYLVKCSVESPMIREGKAMLELKSKYVTSKRFHMESSVDVIGSNHKLVTFFEKQSKNGKFGIAVRSPLLAEGSYELGGSYSENRRSNKIGGEVTFSTPRKTHKLFGEYQRDVNQAIVEVVIESDDVSPKPLKTVVKYVNGNDRDIALTLSVYGNSVHEIVATVQNYDTQKLVELKATSPLLPSRTASITGTLKTDKMESFDGVLTVLGNNKEYRVASSMKRRRGASVEGFLAVNTPHEPFRMFRVDLDYKNDRFRNFDCNLKFKSSHKKYDAFGITMKLNRTQGTGDMSVVLTLPSQTYPTVQLLGNMHYNRDMTVADGRLTMSIAPERYSVYGTYKLQGSRLTLDGEFERNSRKSSAQMQFEWNRKMSMYGQFFTPDRRMYSASCSAISSDNQHSVAMTYRLPWQEPFSMNATLDYYSFDNFNSIVEASTPFPKYSQIFFRLQNQRSGRTQTFANVEYVLNDYRLFLNLFRRVNTTDAMTTLRLGTPYRSVREFDLTYSGNELKRSFVLRTNGREAVKGEMIRSRGNVHASMDMPLLPMTVTARTRYHRSNQEVLMKSSYGSRTMSLKYTHQNDARSWMNEGVLIWDEETGKSLGYSAKLSDISNGQMNGKEMTAKLTFPLREFEVKGRIAKSGRVNSGGIDFYWDASRDKSKHMTVGVEHHELSKRGELSRKLEVTFTHPMLERDLVYMNTLMVKSNEIMIRSELQYSRQNEQNLVSEFRSQTSSRGDQRYDKAELSIRHVASELNLKVAAELMRSRSEDSLHISLSHLNRAMRRTLNEFRVKIQKLRGQIDVEMRNDRNQQSLSGTMVNKDDGETVFSLIHSENGREGFQSRLRYNQYHNSMDLNVTGLGGRGLLVSASYPKDSVSFKISHFSDVSQVTDASVYVGLEKSKILKYRVSWRPGMWRDFRSVTGDVLRSTLSSTGSVAKSLVKTVRQEHDEKISAFKREMSKYFENFRSSLSEDADAISRDIDVMREQFLIMYRRNEFYMKDIVAIANEVYEGLKELYNAAIIITEVMTNIILEYVDEMYYRIMYALEDLSEYLKTTCCKFMSSLKVYCEKMLNRASDVWLYMTERFCDLFENISVMAHMGMERLASTIEPMVKSYAPFIIDSYYYIRLKSDKLRQYLNDAVTTVTKSPLYVAFKDYWNRIVYTIESFELADITSSIQSRILLFGDRAGLFMQKISDAQLLDIVRNRLPVEYIVRSTLQKGADLYDFLKINMFLKKVMDYGLQHVKNTILTSGNELLYEFYQMRSSVKYEYDAKKGGYFYFEYILPSSQNSIYDFVSSFREVNLRKITEMKNAMLEKYYEDFCIWDTFYAAKNILKPSTWMPPYDAHAMIAGNQHFVTFDKYSFDFAGECSYLLVRDFLDKNFTVVANYKKEGQRAVRKSITITSGEFRVELATDHKVTLNDVKVELPLLAGEMVLLRDGSTVRVENKKKGFVVSCNLVYDVCTVGMSGYYFGKTGGLFGTYDNEPRLDMMTPDRTLATDVESFVNSWEVGREACRKGENMATIPSNNRDVYEKCREMFGKTTSAFRPCFKQVDPNSYMRMCVSDLSVVSNEDYDSAICTSAAAYFTECNIAGVSLKMPTSCVQCNRYESKALNEGDMMMVNSGHNVVHSDVVFVVEEKKCNEQNYKYLGKLAQSIEDNFRQRGFLDIRYRVVGFGGNFPHDQPHVHTMDGQEYGSIRSVESAFRSLEIGDGPTNMLQALRFAASLDYHPGSKKVFVLIKCSTCDVHENRAEYGEVLRTMLDGNVDLHILMEQKYEMRIANKNPKAKKVIGIDKNYAYTLKDAKDPKLEGDGDLQMQLKIPKDICVSLALEVNGSLFDSQYITETKRNTYKKFMDVMARRMAKSAAHRPEWTMCCECIASTDGVGKSACQKCVPQEFTDVSPYYPEYSNTLTGNDDARGSEKKRRPH